MPGWLHATCACTYGGMRVHAEMHVASGSRPSHLLHTHAACCMLHPLLHGGQTGTTVTCPATEQSAWLLTSAAAPAPPPAGCLLELDRFDQCGGSAHNCISLDGTKDYCLDVAWPDRCCPDGSNCNRVNDAYWQCQPPPSPPSPPRPPPKSKPPSPPQRPPQPPGGICAEEVVAWGQCGGTSGNCFSSAGDGKRYCKDAPWPDRCCKPGATCRRRCVQSALGWPMCPATLTSLLVMADSTDRMILER